MVLYQNWGGGDPPLTPTTEGLKQENLMVEGQSGLDNDTLPKKKSLTGSQGKELSKSAWKKKEERNEGRRERRAEREK